MKKYNISPHYTYSVDEKGFLSDLWAGQREFLLGGSRIRKR
jgi:hypothetical protein